MNRVLASVAAVVMGIGAFTAGAGNVGAGPLDATRGDFLTVPVTLNYWVYSPDGDAATIADGLTGELFTDTGADVTSLFCSTVPTTLPQSSFTVNCDVDPDDYVVGVSGIPSGYYVRSVDCFTMQVPEAIDDPGAAFTAVVDSVECNVFVDPIPRVYVDKVVQGGAAIAADFTIEVYDDSGAFVTVVDPSDTTCSTLVVDDADCGSVQVEPGTYVLGEEFVYGYDPSNVSCAPYFDARRREQFPFPGTEFEHGVEGSDTLCTVTNFYVTRTVIADIVVENDSGGTATGADFTIEVFDDTGAVVDSGVDPEPGTGNAGLAFDLPIGDYTFGVSGPDGYTATVAVTVVPVDAEIIDDPSADFALDVNNAAAGVITMNDPTTTTTTLEPTTTLVPTTTQAATTTTLQGILPATTTTLPGILPATGGDQSSTLALLALGLVAFGGGAFLLARRR